MNMYTILVGLLIGTMWSLANTGFLQVSLGNIFLAPKPQKFQVMPAGAVVKTNNLKANKPMGHTKPGLGDGPTLSLQHPRTSWGNRTNKRNSVSTLIITLLLL